MNFSDGFNQGMYDGDIDINITNTNQNVNDNTNMNYNNGGGQMMGDSVIVVLNREFNTDSLGAISLMLIALEAP